MLETAQKPPEPPKIRYPKGTKKYLVAQRLIAGDSINQIIEDLKVKRGTVHNVKSEIKKLGLLKPPIDPQEPDKPDYSPNSLGTQINQASLPETSPHSPAEQITRIQLPQSSPVGKPLERSGGAVVSSLEKPVSFPGEGIVEIEGFPVGRKIRLTPKNLTLMDWFISKYGYKGDASDFINDCIEDFFVARGFQLKVIKEENV